MIRATEFWNARVYKSDLWYTGRMVNGRKAGIMKTRSRYAHLVVAVVPLQEFAELRAPRTLTRAPLVGEY